jgi:arginase family enzyme
MTVTPRGAVEVVIQPRPAATFFGAPVADIEDLRSGMIAVIGVYCDHFCEGHPGGRFAARQIRYVSTKTSHGESLPIVDLGDFNVFPLDPERTLESLTRQSQHVIAAGAKLFAIGGDYSMTPAIVRGISRELGSESIAVIRLSRRFDLLAPPASEAQSPRRTSATFQLSNILGGGPSAIALMGARGRVTAEEQLPAKASIVVPASQLIADSSKFIGDAKAALSQVAESIYLSVDADVLAPRFGATATTGTYDGLSLAQLLEVLDNFKDLQLVGAELTGHVPNLDVSGRAVTHDIMGIASKLLECLSAESSACR